MAYGCWRALGAAGSMARRFCDCTHGSARAPYASCVERMVSKNPEEPDAACPHLHRGNHSALSFLVTSGVVARTGTRKNGWTTACPVSCMGCAIIKSRCDRGGG